MQMPNDHGHDPQSPLSSFHNAFARTLHAQEVCPEVCFLVNVSAFPPGRPVLTCLNIIPPPKRWGGYSKCNILSEDASRGPRTNVKWNTIEKRNYLLNDSEWMSSNAWCDGCKCSALTVRFSDDAVAAESI